MSKQRLSRLIIYHRHQLQPVARSKRRSGLRARVGEALQHLLLHQHRHPRPKVASTVINSLESSIPALSTAISRFYSVLSILTNISRHIVKDKANHAVVLDKATADKLQKDVQSYRLITVAVLVDRLKINGSLARSALKDLEEQGTIKKVVGHSRMLVYSE
jgi:small subunit ribosomal protein S25e